jgi:tripartite-type tricarboxylate transporter receptor subunit TctC
MKIRPTALVLIAAFFAASGQANAQAWPSKPIRLIVGFAPGGGTDYVARTIAPRLSEALGQPIIVENKPGASAMLGNELVAKSAPDGYTLVTAAAGAMAIAPNFQKAPYDTFKDFEHVSLIVSSPFLLVVHPGVPAKTVAEFNALAKSKPGSVNFGSAGTGGAPHLAGELYKRMAGVEIVHVPYKGLAPALADLLGGQIQAVFADVGLTIKNVEAGKLRAIAITGSRRFAAMPNVPTVAEAGVPGYRAETWYGISAPAGTPAPIVSRLAAEVRKAVASPELQRMFEAQGLIPNPLGPAEFTALVREDYSKWAKLIKDADIRP